MARRVGRVTWDLVLTIGGETFRCADYSWSFSLNKIPLARVTLAVGRDVRRLERARVHTPAGAEALRNMNIATVKLIPRGHWTPEDIERFGLGEGQWDQAGDQIIFEGRLTGVGYRKQRGALSYTVTLIHWLSDLDFSSALSNQSHPGNPARFRWRSCFRQLGRRTITPESYFLTSKTAVGLFTPTNIQNDLWGRALHQMFCDISGEDLLELTNDPCTGWDEPNTFAQDALKRIECNLGFQKAPQQVGVPETEILFDDPPPEAILEEVIGTRCEEGAKSPYHVPLRFSLGGIPGLIAKSIGLWCRKQSMDSYFNSTLWGKIVGEIGPQFDFAVVPKIRTAQVIPFVPGLRHTYDVALSVQDMVAMDMQSQIPRPLRAVGITSPVLATNNHAGNLKEPLRHVGGCYSPGPGIRGMVKFIDPPNWLAILPSEGPVASDTALVPGGSETTPGTIGAFETDTSVMEAHNELEPYYERYAHTAYVREMLRGRWGVVSGKVRFDIAPGTTVAIRNQDPLHISGDAQSQNLVGEVLRVTGLLSAEAQKGSTGFQIAYLRTEGENTEDATSVDRHPLYEEYFGGAPLLHAYKFD